jgi:invasion protein IalB
MRLFSVRQRAKSRRNDCLKELRIVKIRSVCRASLAVTIVFNLAGAVFAQDTQVPEPPKNLGPRKTAPAPGAAGAPEAPKVDTVATHGKWAVQCTEVPAQAGQPAQKSCGMVTTANNEKNPNIGISLIINKVKQGDKSQTLMRAMVPMGVYLPTGVAMEIDGTALDGRMNFTRCIGRACEGFGEMSEVTVKKFSKGKVATFYIYDRPGNGYPIAISLEGFGEGLADLAKQKN